MWENCERMTLVGKGKIGRSSCRGNGSGSNRGVLLGVAGGAAIDVELT